MNKQEYIYRVSFNETPADFSGKHNFFNEIKKVSPNFFDITESLSVSGMINSTAKVVDYQFY